MSVNTMDWSDYYTLAAFGLACISMYLLEKRGYLNKRKVK